MRDAAPAGADRFRLRHSAGPAMVNDQQLMMRAAEGDMDAFEELVSRHQQSALNVAYHFLSDHALAEDIAQEAFLRVLAGAARYRPLASFRTYLFSVIWHLCVDLRRKKVPRPLESLPPRESDAEGPADAALRDERRAIVAAAVGQLPSRQRMALVLKHYENLSYEEIARTIGCSVRAVDALLVRAKRKLREALRDVL